MQDSKFWDDIYSQGLTPWTDENKDKRFAMQMIKDTDANPTSKVLDYGCGAGTIGEHLLHNGISVDFAEISKIEVEFLKQKFGNKSNVYWACEPKDIDGKYDIIICSAVLHHIEKEKWPDFLKQFNTLLSKGGFLWLTGVDKSDNSLTNRTGNFVTTLDKCSFISEIIPMVESCGFMVVKNYSDTVRNITFDKLVTYRVVCLKKTND